jgi:hypothetical protein
MKAGVVSFDTYIQNEVYTPLVNFGAKQVGIYYGVQELRKIVGVGTPDLAVTTQRQSILGQVGSIGSVNLNTSLNGLQTTVNQPASNQPTTSGGVKATLGNINMISSALRMDDIIGPSLTFFPLEDDLLVCILLPLKLTKWRIMTFMQSRILERIWLKLAKR